MRPIGWTLNESAYTLSRVWDMAKPRREDGIALASARMKPSFSAKLLRGGKYAHLTQAGVRQMADIPHVGDADLGLEICINLDGRGHLPFL